MSESRAYLTQFRPRFRPPSAADLCTPVPCMTAGQTNEDVMEAFSRHRDLAALPVVEDGRPIGLINRNIFRR
ncbi:CBS domain-containing protein [Paracidovorax citrulli]|nr:CBS domain-containing protein [Paracidovorax citrulli]